MLFDIDKHTGIALEDYEERTLSYKKLALLTQELSLQNYKRGIAIMLCDNDIESVAFFISLVDIGVVPLLLNKDLDIELINNYISTYKPQYVVMPNNMLKNFPYTVEYVFLNYVLAETGFEKYDINVDLAFLLSTSGTTGSPKLVRHSYKNLLESVKNVAGVFNLSIKEKAMATLPLYFTQGLNVILSNIYAGGKVILNNKSLMSKEFWTFLIKSNPTSITGVPYSYEIMLRLGLLKMNLPHLRIINQGGGRLSDSLYKRLASYARETNKEFIPTYGSSETTSRMCYLSPRLSCTKIGSIGKPIPPGRIELIGADDTVIDKPNTIGEIVYYGPNVTMGYANQMSDLALGDERKGMYKTGDMAYFDEDGCYFIVGRKGRFVKIYGYRVSLDEVEKILKTKYNIDFACTGNDSIINIYHEVECDDYAVVDFISNKTGIIRTAFKSFKIEKIPRNNYGKVLYKLL